MNLADDTDTLTLLVDQLGVASRAQLIRLGWRADQVDGAVRRGRLQVVHRGIYRVAGGGRPPGQAAMAAVLRLGAGTRVTAEWVLAHHGLGELAESTVGIAIVASPHRPRAASIPWRRDLAPQHDHASLGPVPATTVARALVELGASWTDRRWLAVLDLARWRRLATTAGVVAAAERLRGHHGARRVIRLAATGDLEQESPGERDLASALHAIGIQPAQVRWQVQILPHRRVDALLPGQGVILEYDGRDFHTDPRDRARDEARDRELVALGYVVLHLQAADIRDRRRLRARLDHAIASRSLQGGGVSSG